MKGILQRVKELYIEGRKVKVELTDDFERTGKIVGINEDTTLILQRRSPESKFFIPIHRIQNLEAVG